MSTLTLKSIKTSPYPNRVNLIFSDTTYLPFFVDDYIKLSLKKAQEIDKDLFSKLCQMSYAYLLKDYAIRQIALSPKTPKSLLQKLHQKKVFLLNKYPILKDHIDHSLASTQIIDQLKEQNLLDLSSYVDYVLRRFPNKSKNYLVSYLQKQGVSPSDYSNSVFDKLDPQALIKKYLLKKNYSNEDLTDFKTKNKIISSLLRKGFTLSEVKTAIDDYLIKL